VVVVELSAAWAPELRYVMCSAFLKDWGVKGPATWGRYISVTSTQEVSSPEINPVNKSVGI